MTTYRHKRVLSVQSHVVYGYVGNKAATFPLQCHGFDVDPVNAVQFSNHSGYPTKGGEKLTPAQLEALCDGLEANGMLGEYTHVLTGYIGNAETLKSLAKLVRKMRAANPELVVVVDTVMGDNGKLYVPEDVMPVYRDVLCPLASVITPNGFEASLLTGQSLTTLPHIRSSLTQLHAKSIPTIIITSTTLTDFLPPAAISANPDDWIYLIASQPTTQTFFMIPMRKRQAHFTGTGDLFGALLLANMDVPVKDTITASQHLKDACLRSVAVMQAVLDETTERQCQREKARNGDVNAAGWSGDDAQRRAMFLRDHELAIVQCRGLFTGERVVQTYEWGVLDISWS
ncbi:uncharacterized protein EV422DRAFT_128662 [Fimicolochytrium jonesii]|uniref:uncharacterized protein n=1 Tax=Fimicolochytrium jonesii TaxID=1396493 RepID=UPI0022FEA29D|nr:uncharacterized protein EV422DRAFT_128662 [Fimicolochytrium jonesii]KAI8818985.1 hypothetical protein EV422DRAFT_128662 [Fimicolochytrium jonesii]